MMSYELIVERIEAKLRNVAGLSNVISHEPTSVEGPMIISVFDRFERQSMGQKTAIHYYTIHTLVIPWQDNQEAERSLRKFINSVPAAIDADPTLGGRCNRAEITSATAGFGTIGSTKYRIVDFESKVLEKPQFQSGI